MVVRQRSVGAVLEDEVEERVDRVLTTALDADLAERLPDHRGVGAGDDVGVEEVAVPDPRSVLALVVLAEGGAVGRVAHQLLAGDLLLQVQRRRAGAELLEDDEVDAVGVDLEGHRQVLEPEVGAEPVHERREPAQQVDHERDRLDVRRRQQRGLQRCAPPPDRPERLGDQALRPLDVGTGLQHPAASAQLVAQRLQLAATRVRRRQRPRAAQVAVELVEEQLLGGHADESGVQCLTEHRLHPGLLVAGWPDVVARGAVQAHDRGPDVGVADERRQVGAERQRLQRGDVLPGRLPVLVLLHRADDVLTGDRLDSTEQVAGVDRTDVHGREGARPEQDRGDAVADRLDQRRPVEHLDVVMRVDVDHARHDPLPGGVEDLGAAGLVERLGRDRGDVTVHDADVPQGRGPAAPVEPAAALDDRVVGHRAIEAAELTRVKCVRPWPRTPPRPRRRPRRAARRRSRAAAGTASRCPRCRRSA